MSARPLPHRFSVPQYERMLKVGILKEDDRVELIRGEIVAKMPIGDPHIACVDRLNRFFVRAVGDDVIVSIQNPIRLPDSQPEPDVVVKKARDGFYGKPEPASGGRVRQVVTLKQGISEELGREIVRKLKADHKKVQAQVQGDAVRVTAKVKDDLQGVIKDLRAQDYPVPLQFINYR